MEIATGYYLNLFDKNGKRDIFVIFNEPNVKPTKKEIHIISELVEREFSKNPDVYSLQKLIENMNLRCVEYGVQVVVNRK